MKRLIPEALFSNEMVDEHTLREYRQTRVGQLDGQNDFTQAINCMRKNDPHGQKSASVLHQLLFGRTIKK